MEKRNKNVGTILGIVMLLLMIIGVTYAAFQYTKKGTKENEITTGTVSFKYNETGNGVTLTNAYPMSDGEGKKMNKGNGEGDNGYFDFDVTSTLGADMEIQYYVYAVDITGDIENKLDPKYVKVYLTDQSSPENPYGGYEGEVPVYSELDNVKATDENKEPVEGKLLYQNRFTESGEHLYRLRLWVSDEYETTDVSKIFKIRVDVNTDAEITSGDTDKPTCEVVSAEPKKASRDEDISMTIKCSDNFGTVTSNMTSNNIHIKQNGSEVQPTKKELSDGIALAEVTGRHGVQHTLTLNGFENEGDITITIDQGVLQDKKGNTNDEIELTPGVSISKRVTVTLANGGGVQTFGEQDTLTCDIKEGDTCSVVLPTITPNEGYTGAFWSEEEDAHEGKTGNIEVSSDTTYYAIGYKEVTSTYTIGEGVDSIGKESDKCTYYGKETSCKVELPSIKSKEGYYEGKWALITGGEEIEPNTQVDITDNETAKYTATAKDTTEPVCRLNKITTPSQPLGTEEKFEISQKDEEATVVIDCTDTSGSISDDLSLEEISIKYEDKEATATITEEGSGTDIENGREHTYKMKDFSSAGENLIVVISENAVKDSSNNGCIQTDITTGLIVKSSDILGLPVTDSTDYNSATDDEKHGLWKFEQPSTDQKDATTDYRYIGNDPYNYLKFEGDSSNTMWRIIGVFTDPSSTNDTSERLKIMRNDSIGQQSWDSSNSNNWTRPSSLQTTLNSGTFWTGLAQVTKNRIETMNWYLGGVDINYYSYSTAQFYSKERGSAVPSGAKATWPGNVGLIYPSDYGYTYANGVGTSCYNKLCDYDSCNPVKEKSWMWPGDSSYPWTITPQSDHTNLVFYIEWRLGRVYSSHASYTYMVHPVVYLKSDTLIKDGSGQSTDPYIVANN